MGDPHWPSYDNLAYQRVLACAKACDLCLCKQATVPPLQKEENNNSSIHQSTARNRNTDSMANASHVGTLPLSRILSLYPRERLFVHPLIWTQRQLDLLGCTFHFSNCDNNDDDDDEENSETPQKWTPAKTLVESNEFVDKLLVMEDLWYGLYGERWFLAYVFLHSPFPFFFFIFFQQ